LVRDLGGSSAAGKNSIKVRPSRGRARKKIKPDCTSD
jgi:hypothetical protein